MERSARIKIPIHLISRAGRGNLCRETKLSIESKPAARASSSVGVLNYGTIGNQPFGVCCLLMDSIRDVISRRSPPPLEERKIERDIHDSENFPAKDSPVFDEFINKESERFERTSTQEAAF